MQTDDASSSEESDSDEDSDAAPRMRARRCCCCCIFPTSTPTDARQWRSARYTLLASHLMNAVGMAMLVVLCLLVALTYVSVAHSLASVLAKCTAALALSGLAVQATKTAARRDTRRWPWFVLLAIALYWATLVAELVIYSEVVRTYRSTVGGDAIHVQFIILALFFHGVANSIMTLLAGALTTLAVFRCALRLPCARLCWARVEAHEE